MLTVPLNPNQPTVCCRYFSDSVLL